MPNTPSIYDELDDNQKCEHYPDEFLEELQEQFQSGEVYEAVERAEEQGIDVDELAG
jgi:hypothetical protein